MAFTAIQSKWELVMIEEKLFNFQVGTNENIADDIQKYSHWNDTQKLTFLRNWANDRTTNNTAKITKSNQIEVNLNIENTELGAI
jgi:hypothetical protein